MTLTQHHSFNSNPKNLYFYSHKRVKLNLQKPLHNFLIQTKSVSISSYVNSRSSFGSLRILKLIRMAAVGALIGGRGSASPSWTQMKKDSKKKRNQIYNNNSNNKFRVSCVSTMSDCYKTLKIRPGASESEVRKAFRKLALQYHPDVCRGSNCGVQFHQINEAYEAVMSSLREEPEMAIRYDDGPSVDDDTMRGMYDPDYDMWEEWMGWEGAGIRDYSSHINPYI